MKKKMITFLLTAAMGFAALSPATVQAADNSIATYATESTQGTIKLDKNGRAKYSNKNLSMDAVHCYRFTPKTAGDLKTIVKAKKENVNVRLVEEFSDDILSDWNASWNTSQEYTQTYSLSKGTTYLIEVKNWASDRSSNPYNVTFQFKGYKETFPENFLDQVEEKYDARTVGLNKTYYGFNGAGSDVDWFKFTVVSKGALVYSGEAYKDVYNSNGDHIDNWWLDSLGKGTYYIKISGKGYGGYNFRINDEKAARPKATSVTKLSSGKKSFKVTAKKVTAKGYQVQYSEKSNFKGSKTKTFGSTSYTVKGLKAKKRYYVRVRAYNNYVDHKVYSSWSAKKSVKTK